MEQVTFGSGLPGYEIGDKTAPALVVIQEWWGINASIKALAQKLHTDTGFRVFIPDLYKGKIGVDAEEASHLMNNLDFQNAVAELKQAVQYLKDTGSPKVGACGFCMGGALTFCAAQHCAVEAAAPFYGTPNPAVCEVEKITVPVEAHFGEDDPFKGFADVETAKAHAAKMTNSPAFYFYPACGHAFMNVLVPEGAEMNAKNNHHADQAQVQVAYERLVAFMKKHLA